MHCTSPVRNRCATPLNQLIQRASALMLLAVLALITSSCATSAKATGSHIGNTLAIFGSLPAGNVNKSYNAVFAVGGGASPYLFSIASGSLPPGVTLNQNTGSLTGIPSTIGSYNFEILVTDAAEKY